MSTPWMPLYISDYLADTSHLSTLEHGAYLLLIMHYWRNAGLPDDEKKLARICRLTPRQWDAIRDTLAEFFGDGWAHHRIDKELSRAADKSERRAASGSRGGIAKSLKNNKAPLANAKNLLEQNDSNALASSSQPQNTSSLRSDDGGAVAEPAAPMTAKSRLWAEGVPILETFGLSKQARGLIGRWLKQTHDDAFPILDAIQRARDHGVVDAVPWITASLANPRQDRRNDRSNNVSDAFDRIKARLDGRTDPASDGLERDDGYSAGRPVPGFAGRLL